MTAPTTAPPVLPDPAGATDREAAIGWTALAAAIVVGLIHLAPAVGLGPGGLAGDAGIQWFLGSETARGAVPLVDFEHTWNVGAWWFNAALHRLSGGDASVWLYLWARVFGPALAAVTAVGVLWRLRLRPEWILIGAGAWLALSHVIHAKYTIPVVWAFVLVPAATRMPGRATAGRSIRRGVLSDPATRRAVLARALLAGLTMLSQVELAVLLGAGVVLYDLVGREDLPVSHRIVRAAAIPLGAAVALAVELAAYAAIGQPPGEILRQLFSNAAETAEGFNYGYPVFSAPSLRPKLFPASLLLAFVPLVWRRLAPGTRLVACLHLAQALIAIRRPDAAHVDAATTLLGLLVALTAHDLLTDPRGQGSGGQGPLRRALDRRRWTATDGLAALAGAAVVALLLGIAFGVASLLSVVVPTAAAGLAALWADRRDTAPAASAGALVAVVALVIASTAGGITSSLRSGDALAPARDLAEQLAAPLARCTGGTDRAWVVPEPLALYEELGITNATPYAVFWYGFGAEHDAVRAMLDAESIPAIIQVGSWPESFGDLPDDIALAMAPCAVVQPEGAEATTIWVPAD